MRNDENRIPIWLGGIVLALILIFISTRGGAGNQALSQHFAPQPTDPNAPSPAPLALPQVRLPGLPPDMQSTLTSIGARIAGGQSVPALTPVVSGPRIRVTIPQIKREGDRILVSGSVENLSDKPLAIPTNAFSFRDSAGVVYTTSGDSSTLQPGQRVALNLSVSPPAERGLTLVVTLPPDPPLDQVLILEPTP